MTDVRVTEATLEVRAADVLRRRFPSLAGVEIRAQGHLRIRLGHQKVIVDGKSDVNGRYDLLMLVAGEPKAIVELKAPDIALTADDKHQATSYARLMDPMPPIAIVSNGKDTRVYRTFDRREVGENEPLATIATDTMRLAESELQSAMKGLLGRDPRVWSAAVALVTDETLANATGPLTTLDTPIAEDLIVPRTMTSTIADAITTAGDTSVHVVLGPPLAGKTNLLAELVQRLRRHGRHPLLVRGYELESDIHEALADQFAEIVFAGIDGNDVRKWLRTSLRLAGSGGVVVLLDGVMTSDFAALQSLVRVCNRSGVPLVMTTDENSWAVLRRTKGGSGPSLIGKKATVHQLENLSDTECEHVLEFMLKRGLMLAPGWHHSEGLRELHVLRPLFSVTPLGPGPDSARAPTADQIILSVLPPSIGIGTLDVIYRAFLAEDDELRFAYLGYAEELLSAQRTGLLAEPEVLLYCTDRGAIPRPRVESEAVRCLRHRGHLRLADGPSGHVMLLPTRPVLLAAALVQPIVGALDQGRGPGLMTRQLSLLPLKDVVVASALRSTQPVMLTEFVEWALARPPRKHEMKEGSMVSMMIEGRVVTGKLPPIEDDDWGHSLENMDPALVLSHLAGKIAAETPDGELNAGPLTFTIWRELGKTDFPIVGTDVKRRTVHTIDGGEILCGSAALVEPLTRSMADAIADPRIDMLEFAGQVRTEANIFLAYRLWYAAQSMTTSVDPGIAAKALEVATAIEDLVQLSP